ncbi:LAME_0F08284g1_1 [Lachancea meyersii CBS 8951]|uniref:LAME_0F08284g1_1 n=1 Tax=Lachancea meyersii CBS 8951 TaxID=1266667 RepID=A0A1G4JUR6_9SACH|nr:LAME_0F08284g1_1 [Lachancea meyersii CBS 8951]
MSGSTVDADGDFLKGLEVWSKNPVHVRPSASSASHDHTRDHVRESRCEISERNEVDSRSIFLRNISNEVTAHVLERKFRCFGIINRITIFSRKSEGKLKTYAYIEFDNTQSAEQSLSFNKTKMDEHVIGVVKKRTNIRGWRTKKG